MKRFILKVELPDDKAKHKALKTVSTLSGIDSIAMDMKEKQLTVIGTVDPITVVTKLRKHWPTDIVIVGPAKEPEKPQEPNEPKKEEEPANKEAEPKKEDSKEPPKKEEEEEAAKKDGVKEEDRKKEIAVVTDPLLELAKVYPEPTSYYYVQSTEENPNACVVS